MTARSKQRARCVASSIPQEPAGAIESGSETLRRRRSRLARPNRRCRLHLHANVPPVRLAWELRTFMGVEFRSNDFAGFLAWKMMARRTWNIGPAPTAFGASRG